MHYLKFSITIILKNAVNNILRLGENKVKFTKLDFMLYIKNSNLNLILYALALLVIFIPITIVLITNMPFSASVSKIFTAISFMFIISGKLITIFTKREIESISIDICIIVGMIMVFFFYMFR